MQAKGADMATKKPGTTGERDAQGPGELGLVGSPVPFPETNGGQNTSPSVRELLGALLKAQVEFGPVVKTISGQEGNRNYKYADLAGLLDAVTPALRKNGLLIVQTMRPEDLGNVVITTLFHTSGEWIRGETWIPLREAGNPKAVGSAISYARRYAILPLLCLAAEDDDGESAMHREEKRPPASASAAPNGAPKPAQDSADLYRSRMLDAVRHAYKELGLTEEGMAVILDAAEAGEDWKQSMMAVTRVWAAMKARLEKAGKNVPII